MAPLEVVGNVVVTNANLFSIAATHVELGTGANASGLYSTALGEGTTASGQASTALGYETKANGDYSTALGEGTTASGGASTAFGFYTTASGGDSTALGEGTTASGLYSTALGEGTTASGQTSTALGYGTTASGDYSTALGCQATASQFCTFVWADAAAVAFDPYALSGPQGVPDSFNVRASGGVYLVTAVNAISGAITAGTYLAGGSGGWVAYSDRNGKDNFQDVNQREILEKVAALPLTTWNYKAQDGSIRHLGPMAQDFKAAFGLGESATGINTVDADGVALAAIQGLNQKVEADNTSLRSELKAKYAEIQDLKQSVTELKALVEKLAGK